MAGTASGIVFDEPSPMALEAAVVRALTLRSNPKTWKQIQLTGMRQDFSWKKSAVAYQRLYDQAQRDTQG